MAYINYSRELLDKFCMEAFQKFGFNESESRIISDVLLMSDDFGIESHGMQRLVRYHKGIESGLIKIDAKPEIVFETPISAVIDGHSGMGQLLGHKAMEMAIEKAKVAGVGIVSVKNSNHYGIAGYYARMAMDQGLIGFSCTNSEAIMVPTFGKKAMLGSNPIAVCAPADPYPFFFDASTTVVTRGKLEMYNKMDKPIPTGWAVNKAGESSNSANEVLGNIKAHEGGGIVPLGGDTEQLGGHKGYGYGMLCELFASILSQGNTSAHTMKNGFSGICHGFMAINPAFFGNPEDIKNHFSQYLTELRESPKANGAERIYTHGEKEMLAVEKVKVDGIPVNENTVREMIDMAEYLGMDVKAYFGDFDYKNTNFKSSY
jgi:LDH2 family malate/lactate/ureidoglycolate dehydrogenase